MGFKRIGKSLVVTAGLLLAPLPAHAWTPAKAQNSGCMTRWYAHDGEPLQIAITTDSKGIDGIPAATVQTHIQQALATWNQVQCGLCNHPGGSGCAPEVCAPNPLGVELVDAGIAPHTPIGLPCGAYNPDGSCAKVQANGNFVLSVTDPKDWHWGQFQIANTPVTANLSTGEIIDADVVFNHVQFATGVPFQACAGDCVKKPAAYPLCIILTHELGHVLGLDHSLVPKAVMEAAAVPSQTFKCALAEDDATGICTVYRTTCSGLPGEITPTTAECVEKAKANVSAPPVTVPSACQASRAGPKWAVLGIIVATGMVWRLRRRQHRVS